MQGTDDPLGRDSWAMLNFGAKALAKVYSMTDGMN